MGYIKKPSEVAGKSSFMEGFQVAYGFYDIMHKIKTRNLAGEKYTRDSIQDIFNT